MLMEHERELVERELLAVSIGDPRTILVAGLPLRLAGGLREGLPPRLLVGAVVDVCIADGYTDTPPALATLLTRLLAGIEGIDVIVKRLRLPPPPQADPFAALILDNKLPFLARPKVRAYLQALTGPTPTQPVVLVLGNSKSGKTYTSEFVDYLRRAIGLRLCRIAITPDQGKSTGPAELARDIIAQIGGDLASIPKESTDQERWAQDLSNTIVSTANKDGLGWWFILDGFNDKVVRDDTRKFILKLAVTLNSGLAQQLHRLILIDFDRSQLTILPGKIGIDTTQPIPASAVRPAALLVIKASGRAVDPEPFIERLIDGLPDPIVDLLELGDRFRKLTEILES